MSFVTPWQPLKYFICIRNYGEEFKVDERWSGDRFALIKQLDF